VPCIARRDRARMSTRRGRLRTPIGGDDCGIARRFTTEPRCP
jgi:hypothetical protein